MALYSIDEICRDCIHAQWHKCVSCYSSYPQFCHCTEDNEPMVSYSDRTCEAREFKRTPDLEGG